MEKAEELLFARPLITTLRTVGNHTRMPFCPVEQVHSQSSAAGVGGFSEPGKCLGRAENRAGSATTPGGERGHGNAP